MSKLFFDVGQAGAVLNQEARKCVPQIVNAESAEASVLNGRQEHALTQVAGIEHLTTRGRKDWLLRDGKFVLQHRFEQPLLADFQKYRTKLPRHIHTAGLLALRRDETACSVVAPDRHVPVCV